MNDTINRYLAILCYPFASLDFFLEDYFEKIIRGEDAEKDLQEAMVRHIQENCNVYSYDEIYMYLEKCYLYDLRTKRYKTGRMRVFSGDSVILIKFSYSTV